MSRAKTICALLMASLLISSPIACKVSDDAIAAAEQMTSTANGLRQYYSALSAEVRETISLYELDTAVSEVPYSDEDRVQQHATLAEVEKRRELAESLMEMASAMTSLSQSKAASEVENSATQFGNELIAIKALPDGSPIPAAVGKAGNLLLQAIQQHEEKKTARAIDGTLSALVELFEKEKPAYDSLARMHAREAGQIARDLIHSDAVDSTSMLAPALKPFGLTPLATPTPTLQASLKSLALTRLKMAVEDATQREEAASTAMLVALREMSVRVHLLANEKPMSMRGNPPSLKLVRDWAESQVAAVL